MCNGILMNSENQQLPLVLQWEKRALAFLGYLPLMAGIACFICALVVSYMFRDVYTGAAESGGVVMPFLFSNFLNIIGAILCCVTSYIKKSKIACSMGCLIPPIVFVISIYSCKL